MKKNEKDILKEAFKSTGPEKTSDDFTQNIMDRIEGESSAEYRPLLRTKGWIITILISAAFITLPWLVKGGSSASQASLYSDKINGFMENISGLLQQIDTQYFLIGLFGFGLYYIIDRVLQLRY